MSQVDAGRPVVAVLAAVALISCHSVLWAQDVDALSSPEAPLDPSAPLDPLPDLGVDWPEMEQPGGPISDAPDTSIADPSTERTYTVSIEGLPDDEADAIIERFTGLSVLEANRKDPANAAQIDRRAREDAEVLAELLRAYGYFDAMVQPVVEPGSDRAQAAVKLLVEPGPQYRFSSISLPGLDAAGEDAAVLRQAFGIEEGDPVNAERVTAAEAALRAELGRQGFAFATISELDITLDHESRTATLILPVEPNATRQFGRVIIEGRKLFSAGHVQRIARFRPGDPYEAQLVEDLRRALVATGLVSSLALRQVDNPETRQVDIAVAIEPAPMRTIASAAGYGTGEGVRVEVSWQHRNLIPPEGAVTFRGVAGTREQLVSATLRRNNFEKRDQVLTGQVAVSHLQREAFDARSFLIGVGLERQTNIIWQKKWTWSLGADLIASDERDVDIDSGSTRRRTFFIGALPANLSYDGSNDLLDPTAGFRLSGLFSPEWSLQDGTFVYARAQLDGSFYQPVSDRVVIAGRTRLGTIFGASRDQIAPSRRFYAGGGGSVRGFGYQKLGPRDPIFDDPIGGRSLAEFALEARIRVGDFGIVPFVDAGNIYTSPLPKLDDLRFGAGLGLRYHTRFGPIRLDVGTPLDRRPGDPLVSVYVSLGQAF